MTIILAVTAIVAAGYAGILLQERQIRHALRHQN